MATLSGRSEHAMATIAARYGWNTPAGRGRSGAAAVAAAAIIKITADWTPYQEKS